MVQLLRNVAVDAGCAQPRLLDRCQKGRDGLGVLGHDGSPLSVLDEADWRRCNPVRVGGVTVRSYSPVAGCVTTPVVTTPADVVQMPRRDRISFVFVEEAVVRPC